MTLKSFNNIFKGDKVIWMIFFLLCMISIIEVYSASSSLSYTGGNYWAPLIKHGVTIFIGFVVLIFIMNIKCRYFKLMTPFALFLSFCMLLLLPFLGSETNGASVGFLLWGYNFNLPNLRKQLLF